jgi:hypothetical protein
MRKNRNFFPRYHHHDLAETIQPKPGTRSPFFANQLAQIAMKKHGRHKLGGQIVIRQIS